VDDKIYFEASHPLTHPLGGNDDNRRREIDHNGLPKSLTVLKVQEKHEMR
jgi:hypothetical protein